MAAKKLALTLSQDPWGLLLFSDVRRHMISMASIIVIRSNIFHNNKNTTVSSTFSVSYLQESYITVIVAYQTTRVSQNSNSLCELLNYWNHSSLVTITSIRVSKVFFVTSKKITIVLLFLFLLTNSTCQVITIIVTKTLYVHSKAIKIVARVSVLPFFQQKLLVKR